MSILATKLHVPPLRSKHVLRPRLIERLNESAHRKLALTGYQPDVMIAQARRALDYLSADYLSTRANAHWGKTTTPSSPRFWRPRGWAMCRRANVIKLCDD